MYRVFKSLNSIRGWGGGGWERAPAILEFFKIRTGIGALGCYLKR